uniref:Uncharacterized protein n=1 Tax=Varanus komodoensis TaxID=61221 RepID=A0A8D2Q8E8_VARKO
MDRPTTERPKRAPASQSRALPQRGGTGFTPSATCPCGHPTGHAHGKCSTGRSDTHEWRPWTPPSIWADIVRFSNFSSPEYIMELAGESRGLGSLPRSAPGGHAPLRPPSPLTTGSWHRCPGSRAGCQQSGRARTSGWTSPFPGTSSAGLHRRRSTHPEPPWWQPARSPS